jgi:hypothetical protein
LEQDIGLINNHGIGLATNGIVMEFTGYTKRKLAGSGAFTDSFELWLAGYPWYLHEVLGIVVCHGSG